MPLDMNLTERNIRSAVISRLPLQLDALQESYSDMNNIYKPFLSLCDCSARLWFHIFPPQLFTHPKIFILKLFLLCSPLTITRILVNIIYFTVVEESIEAESLLQVADCLSGRGRKKYSMASLAFMSLDEKREEKRSLNLVKSSTAAKGKSILVIQSSSVKLFFKNVELRGSSLPKRCVVVCQCSKRDEAVAKCWTSLSFAKLISWQVMKNWIENMQRQTRCERRCLVESIRKVFFNFPAQWEN